MLIVQLVTLLSVRSQVSLVHSFWSLHWLSSLHWRLGLWQVLKMLAPCWHCARLGDGPTKANAAKVNMALPAIPSFLGRFILSSSWM